MLCVQLVPVFQGLEYNQQLKIEQLVRRTHVQKQETVLMPGDPIRIPFSLPRRTHWFVISQRTILTSCS